MDKFCRNCGKEILPEQDVCLGCGKMIQRTENRTTKSKNHNTFYTVSSIIMLVLSFCLLVTGVTYGDAYGNSLMIFLLPGMFALFAAILCLVGKKNKTLLIISGVSYIVGGFINFLAILDISIFTIISVIFAILNIVFASKMK